MHGHIVGPTHQQPAKATLYLHGLSFGEFFWDFDGDRDTSYATAQAHTGNTSVVIDRLGYGSSDKLNGNNVCVGSRADMAHQMVMPLRSGSYQVDRRPTPRFTTVALAGHSYGGQIAQVEAYSFGDIDGPIVTGYCDRVQSALVQSNAAYAAKVCSTCGLRVGGAGPAGYAPFGPPQGAANALSSSARPAAQKAVLPLLTIDPCDDTLALRCRILLGCVEGANNQQVAAALRCSSARWANGA